MEAISKLQDSEIPKHKWAQQKKPNKRFNSPIWPSSFEMLNSYFLARYSHRTK